MEFSEENINNYFSALFNGLKQSTQYSNRLFIEIEFCSNWAELKPIQFLSLLSMNVTRKVFKKQIEIVNNTPKTVLSKSKTYNLIMLCILKKNYLN
jgi:hypothetical protein